MLTWSRVAGLQPLISFCFSFIAFICMRVILRDGILLWIFSLIETYIQKQVTCWVETKISEMILVRNLEIRETTEQIHCILGNIELWLSNSCLNCLLWRKNQTCHKMSILLSLVFQRRTELLRIIWIRVRGMNSNALGQSTMKNHPIVSVWTCFVGI